MALNIHHVLGSRLEPSFSEKIHRLELHNAVDEVSLLAASFEQRAHDIPDFHSCR